MKNEPYPLGDDGVWHKDEEGTFYAMWVLVDPRDKSRTMEFESMNAIGLRLFELTDEVARLKAEVERLTKAVKFSFHGGDQLLCDLNKLLTAHRHYCSVNAIDFKQMEKDALSPEKDGKDAQ